MHPALLVARKDLLVLSRDRVALFWVIGFPVAFALFFGNVLEEAIARFEAPSPGMPSGFLRSLPAGMVWGLMSSAATFAVSLVSERTRGTLRRLRASPVGTSALLAGKGLACFAACATVAVVLVAIAGFAYRAKLGHPLALAFAVVSSAIGFVGITLALGASGRSEQAVIGAGWATMLAAAMLGGAMVPASLMPEWLRDAGAASPVRWALVALEAALFRGGTATELAGPCLRLIGLGAAGTFAAVLLLRRGRG